MKLQVLGFIGFLIGVILYFVSSKALGVIVAIFLPFLMLIGYLLFNVISEVGKIFNRTPDESERIK